MRWVGMFDFNEYLIHGLGCEVRASHICPAPSEVQPPAPAPPTRCHPRILPAPQEPPCKRSEAARAGLPRARAILPRWGPLVHALEAVVALLIIAEPTFVTRTLLGRLWRVDILAEVVSQEAGVAAAAEATVPLYAHDQGRRESWKWVEWLSGSCGWRVWRGEDR